MPTFDRVRHEHVLRALEEYDQLGAGEFLEQYGFGRAREYVLWHDGRTYDSKAVLGVAHRYATGVLAAASEFSGGKDGAAKILRSLGFEVTAAGGASSPDHAPPDNTIGKRQAQDNRAPTCPTCHTVLPGTGICDYCA